MSLINGSQNHKDYYQGNNLGNYQFISLRDIISQFEIAYIGDGKIIPKASKLDVGFHAQRAMQELSFDTFKSIKSQQITLPPTLVMPLPHDYVNYTKLSWVDSSGIKHPIYPTSNTSNPSEISQNEDGSYDFEFDPTLNGLVSNGNFADKTDFWTVFSPGNMITGKYSGGAAVVNEKLSFSQHTRNGAGAYNNGAIHTVYQAIDVSNTDFIDLSADGRADTVTITEGNGGTTTIANSSTLRVGITSQVPANNLTYNTNNMGTSSAQFLSPNSSTSMYDLSNYDSQPSYVEWVSPLAGGFTFLKATKEVLNIDVSSYNTVYLVIVSFTDFTVPAGNDWYTSGPNNGLPMEIAYPSGSVDDITILQTEPSNFLQSPHEKNSSTWNKYKSLSPSDTIDNYEDDTYWRSQGERYGLDPQHAQANGSFYIDQRIGRIHFSSNISGKTVILDYMSDGLGSNDEMHVHKFAEEAMYKCIAYGILSTSVYGQQLVPRFKKEKFAAVRQAKLRLSNIKLEEFTQILRGKSKQIKH
tara:strand:- start:9414 stop:10991 length:1578 start_codon:yes stop_codon:yes gene_type:complete